MVCQGLVVTPCLANEKDVFASRAFEDIIGNAAVLFQRFGGQGLCGYKRLGKFSFRRLEETVQSNQCMLLFEYLDDAYMILRKSSFKSATLVSFGLPGRQASAYALSARN